MWAQFALSQHKTAKFGLLLEDDALFVGDIRLRIETIINESLELPPGWMISLGGYDDVRDLSARRPTPGLIEQPITTAEGYLFDAESASLRFQWFKETGVQASNDHSLRIANEVCGIKQYMVLDPLVYQGSVSGRFETTMDGSRAGKSQLFLKARFYWNAFRKRVIPRLISRLTRESP